MVGTSVAALANMRATNPDTVLAADGTGCRRRVSETLNVAWILDEASRRLEPRTGPLSRI
jgi:hypothetical protein